MAERWFFMDEIECIVKEVVPSVETSNRLLFEVSYQIEGEYILEKMSVNRGNGDYHFWYDGNKLKHYLERGKISESNYEICIETIKKQANYWCELFNYPKLAKEI